MIVCPIIYERVGVYDWVMAFVTIESDINLLRDDKWGQIQKEPEHDLDPPHELQPVPKDALLFLE